MNEAEPLHRTQSGSVPVPDPTFLTTQALNAQIAALKELIFTRLDAMDEALKVARDNYTRVPTDIDKAINPLRELFEAKLHTIDQRFTSVGDQFKERDTRIALAEASSKDAIAKSEGATNKQLESLERVGQASSAAALTTFSDLKDRVTRIESLGIGAVTQKAETRAESGAMWVVVGGVLSIAGLLVAGFALAAR